MGPAAIAAQHNIKDADIYGGRERIGRIVGRAGFYTTSLADGRPFAVFKKFREAQAAIIVVHCAGMLALPSRIGARLGHLTQADVALIDQEVRDVLAEVGSGKIPEAAR